jgi:hypothetical protein
VIIALAGRRIDPSDIDNPAFPLAAVPTVRNRLRELLIKQNATTLVSSAACGADLIAQQTAGELGIRQRIVLPFDPTRFRDTSVTDRPGDWGPVFDAIIAEVQANQALINLQSESDTDEPYLQTNQAILNEATSLATESGDQAIAVIVWNGLSRGEDDITQLFAESARNRGLQVLEVSTLDPDSI